MGVMPLAAASLSWLSHLCSQRSCLMYLKQTVGTAGQGLNMTMEDAAELAWHVQQYGLTEDALERFEAKRLPRVKTILDHAKVNRHCRYLSCLSPDK